MQWIRHIFVYSYKPLFCFYYNVVLEMRHSIRMYNWRKSSRIYFLIPSTEGRVIRNKISLFVALWQVKGQSDVFVFFCHLGLVQSRFFRLNVQPIESMGFLNSAWNLVLILICVYCSSKRAHSLDWRKRNMKKHKMRLWLCVRWMVNGIWHSFSICGRWPVQLHEIGNSASQISRDWKFT
jgi:hypothetical protein